MRVDAFDFDLPETCIALRPANPRDASRLMVVRPGAPPHDAVFRDLPTWLSAGDILVVNDTRVIPAELDGVRHRESSTARIRLTLTKRTDPATWEALARPAKRLLPGDRLAFASGETELAGTISARGDGGAVTVRFDKEGGDLDACVALVGHVPLPPYISGRRPTDARDTADYQTVFAEREGAVAAPTAGLHFTDGLLATLAEKGVGMERLTLHVGAGTFLPVKAESIADHRMHAEWGEITPQTAARLNAARKAGGRIVAVGTTSLRLLESATTEAGEVRPFADETSIFITPGYRFRAVDALVTNFHLPRSTLFMLVSAFSGTRTMQDAYAHAIATGYRFYSYGDACLLFPEGAS